MTDAHYRRCDDCGGWIQITEPTGQLAGTGWCRICRAERDVVDGWGRWARTQGDQGCCESVPRELGQVEGAP